MPSPIPTRQALEDQIGRYRLLLWNAEDQLTRDALREVLMVLENELEAWDARELAALQAARKLG